MEYNYVQPCWTGVTGQDVWFQLSREDGMIVARLRTRRRNLRPILRNMLTRCGMSGPFEYTSLGHAGTVVLIRSKLVLKDTAVVAMDVSSLSFDIADMHKGITFLHKGFVGL